MVMVVFVMMVLGLCPFPHFGNLGRLTMAPTSAPTSAPSIAPPNSGSSRVHFILFAPTGTWGLDGVVPLFAIISPVTHDLACAWEPRTKLFFEVG